MVGIGGGTLFTPYFKASGMEPKLAIGTSAAIGLPVSLAGALAYGWQGWGVRVTNGPSAIDMPATLALVLGTLRRCVSVWRPRTGCRHARWQARLPCF